MASPSDELQALVYQTLIANTDVAALVGGRIHDGRPQAYPCITFGPIDYVEDDAECITGRIETMQLDCWVEDSNGRTGPAKILADAVKRVLHRAELELQENALVQIFVPSVRVFMDQDGITGHGVVTVEAHVEETA